MDDLDCNLSKSRLPNGAPMPFETEHKSRRDRYCNSGSDSHIDFSLKFVNLIRDPTKENSILFLQEELSKEDAIK